MEALIEDMYRRLITANNWWFGPVAGMQLYVRFTLESANQ